jgi:eukaryotic-like serine/threonine-protein kinase
VTERFPQQLIGGRYRVRGLLGKGGFGSVYAAEQLGLDRPVALKLLHDTQTDPVTQARFEREARLAQRLEHPNTVRLLDFGFDTDGSPYIVFELLHGKSLLALLREGGAMAPARARRIAIQALKSLMEAHDLGIIHRDIKPGNLLISEYAGEPDFCKVLDFGIAKPLDAQGKALTSAGEVVGTPAYMSPEALAGQTVTPASDLYSLAIVLAEMLSGSRLITGDPVQIMTFQLSHEPLGLPAEVTQSPLAHVVERATRKNPAERYASAAEMLRDLESIDIATSERASLPRVGPTISDTRTDEPEYPRGIPLIPVAPPRKPDEDLTGLLVAAFAIVSLMVAGAYVLYNYFGLDSYLGGAKPHRSAVPSAKRAPLRR